MLAQGLAQLFQTKGYVDILAHLGYPLYLLYIIGVWKLLGVVAIVRPSDGPAALAGIARSDWGIVVFQTRRQKNH
ncbi:DoxX family protein [Spirosoma montaniterrae]|uniref:Uncharacterized protein n=1 Tax=Spirosoma montaniterrae TaxID=1178516 RepID=A0A1P9WW35_9BACT|nr:hypothetical protein AWR27_09735 [Spirosoma montaniterrae]